MALLQLLLLSALVLVNTWWRTGRNLSLFLAGVLFGLAVWGKALMLWVLGGLVIATIATLPWRRAPTRIGGLPWLTLGLLLGAAPLIRYNLAAQGSTLNDNAYLDTQQMGAKLAVLQTTVEGRSLSGFIVRDVAGQHFPRAALVFLLVAATLCAAGLRNSGALFPLVAGVATWLFMALTRDAGGGAHHAILVWPFPQWLIAVAAAGL